MSLLFSKDKAESLDINTMNEVKNPDSCALPTIFLLKKINKFFASFFGRKKNYFLDYLIIKINFNKARHKE
jgi:hypothetical protein